MLNTNLLRLLRMPTEMPTERSTVPQGKDTGDLEQDTLQTQHKVAAASKPLQDLAQSQLEPSPDSYQDTSLVDALVDKLKQSEKDIWARWEQKQPH